jgi:streptomycin 6-kinase
VTSGAARVAVPPGLVRAFAGRPEASGWLAGLPQQVADALDRWDLSLDLAPGEPAWHGNAALVVPVRAADGAPAALKVSWPHREATHEALGLRVWAGDGAVRLLASDGAWTHLLERLDRTRDLTCVPVDEAVEVVGGLLARLHVPAPDGLDTTGGELVEGPARWTERSARFAALVPEALVREARAVAADLATDPRDGTLLHTDLHYTNVLAAEREPWLAIDPKPHSGDAAYEVAPLLWNRWAEAVASGDLAGAVRRRFDIACGAADLDVERARAWVLVREVDNVLWSAEVGALDHLSVHLELARLFAPRLSR